MKKIALILVCSAFLFSCGTATTTEETPAADSTATAVVVDTTVVETATVTVADSTNEVK